MTDTVTLRMDSTELTLTGQWTVHDGMERASFGRYDAATDTSTELSDRGSARQELAVRLHATPSQLALIRALTLCAQVTALGLWGIDRRVLVHCDDLEEALSANRPQDVTVRLVLSDLMDRYTQDVATLHPNHIFTNQFTETFA